MTTYYSRATGNWATTTTWSTTSHAGAAAASAPGTGDTAYIGGGFTVTLGTNAAIRTLYLGGSDDSLGSLNMATYDITFDDNSSSSFIIKAGAANTFTSSATAVAPCYLKSANTNPTNKWTIRVYDQTSIPDSRSLDFDFVELQGNDWYIGNDTYYIDFNGGGTDDPIITDVVPPVPTPTLQVQYCDGRDYPRVYQPGTQSAAAIVTGVVSWDSFMFQSISAMIRSKQRVSLFTRWVHLPLCRIERPSFTPNGSYVKFSLTLVEDR